MNAEDDLGNFFDEINQIEETVITEPEVKSETKDISVSSNFVATSNLSSKNSATKTPTNTVTVISNKPQVLSKPPEINSNTREVYIYGELNSEFGTETSSGFIRDAARETNELTSAATNISSESLASSSASTSSSSTKHANLSQSIGPIGPTVGPPGPPSGPPPSSYPQHKSSGGLNLSLHSYSTSYVTSTAPVAAPAMPKQDKTFVRTGAGEIWIDDSLKDWPENDYRIFVGDLGKETTTEMLAKIFQPYKSFAKAKVIRTKHENKARGFGFVSFMDPMDCAKAIREMQGKYLGTRPMKITRSKWDELDIKQVKKKEQKKRKIQESLGL